MLSVGVDSYVTLEEAEEIAKSTHLSNDKAYVAWLDLSDSDKEVLLRNSCTAINTLKFIGRRKTLGQVLEFPRVEHYPSGIGYRLYISQFVDNGLYSGASSDGGLTLVKQAQVINAVVSGLYNNITVDTIGMHIQGLTSKKAGPISETYDVSRNRRGTSGSTSDAMLGIYTSKVYTILSPWLSGTYSSF